LKNNDIEPRRWYTLRAAADFLEVTEPTVSQYCRDKEFGADAKKVGPKQKWLVRGTGLLRKRREWRLNDED